MYQSVGVEVKRNNYEADFLFGKFPKELSNDKVLALQHFVSPNLRNFGNSRILFVVEKCYIVLLHPSLISTYTQCTTSQHASIYRSLSNKK